MVPLITEVAGSDDYHGVTAPGDLVRRPLVAEHLRRSPREGRGAFYGGRFGEGLVELGAGLYRAEDLDRSQADWVDPLGLEVWDHDVWTVPPNSQGYLTLAAAWIAAGLDLPDDPDDAVVGPPPDRVGGWPGYDRPDVLHEAADGNALVAPDRLATRRGWIDPDRRIDLTDRYRDGGTIYLATLDEDGMGVSLIQSNAFGWGADLTVPGRGLPPQPRQRLQPRAWPPGRVAPAGARPTPVARVGDAAEGRAALGARHDGRRPAAPDRAAASGPAPPPRRAAGDGHPGATVGARRRLHRLRPLVGTRGRHMSRSRATPPTRGSTA